MRSHTHACAPPPFDSRTHSRDVREGERQGAREKEATSSEVREELNEKKEGKGKRDRASARRTKRVEGRYKAVEKRRSTRGEWETTAEVSLRVRRQESWWGPGVALIGSAHFPLRATCSFGRHKRSVRNCQVCFAEKRGCADGNDDEIGTSFAPLTAVDWNDSRRDESKHISA